MSFTLSPEGYFQRDGQRFIPVGANYWPASCGLQMWTKWPEDEIRRDLDLVKKLGLNTLRLIMLWHEFEPEAGCYSEQTFSRLEKILGWIEERDLVSHPALIVGWVNGVLWPEWKKDRNLFEDDEMALRSTNFASHAAKSFLKFSRSMLAVDIGNELCALPDSKVAAPAAVIRWCGEVCAAVKKEFPDVLLVAGNEQAQVNEDSGWHFGEQPGCDFYSMHTYPVNQWHSIRFDGMSDPLAQTLLPFYTTIARSFGPVMVQEMGTILARGEMAGAYLRKVLNACWDAGANGFLYWCMRDITATCPPYSKFPFEGELGLVDANDQIKPGLKYYFEFCQSLATRPAPVRKPAEIGIYWPRHYYDRENLLNPGNDPKGLSQSLIVSNFTLRQLGFEPGIVRGDLDLKEQGNFRAIVIPGALPTLDEVIALKSWVADGGRLVWHGPDVYAWGADLIDFAGAEPIEFHVPEASLEAFGEHWEFAHFPRNIFVELRPGKAIVHAAESHGYPFILRNQFGKGTVVLCLGQPDASFASQSDKAALRSKWNTWYRGMLQLAGVRPPNANAE
jgi:endo-1,4-beta-mannosidase